MIRHLSIWFIVASAVVCFQTSTTSDGLTGFYKVTGGSLHLSCTGAPSSGQLSGLFYPYDGNNLEGGYPVTGLTTTCDASAQGFFGTVENNPDAGKLDTAISCAFQGENDDPVTLTSECLLVNRTGTWPFSRVFYKISAPNSITKGNTTTVS